ncbi:MAG TPA: metal-sensing transcriptional repressor [Candidatus Alectryocaccobium stercorigallinarum]|nr:metal-sensing transcriptional repressor [Candidatus Alectryocaccobium stercorigallinarum]
MENISKCAGCTKRYRSPEEKKKLTNRLKRIEGQIRGIANMLENEVYCIDIINQVAAASAALNSFNKELLASHMKTCVTEDIKDGSNYKMDELVKTIQKLMR